MNQVSLSTTAGKLFWISLVAYCIAFGAFYFMTQYAQSRIVFEEEHGVFATFKADACNHASSCTNFILSNEFDTTQKKLITKLDVPYKRNKPINQEKLQQDYTALIGSLPWYVKRQFAGTLQINASYLTPTKTMKN